MWNQEIASPEKSHQGSPGDGKNIVPLQSAPDRLQLQNTLQRGIAGVISAVQGADTGANHHVRRYVVGSERMHHADLNGAKAATPGENKRRFGGSGVIRYQGNRVRSR